MLSDEELPELPIHDMDERHPGLTKANADHWTEGARVCLDRHHDPPVEFTIAENARRTATGVEWQPPDDRTKLAWLNEIETTEAGAHALALASIELAHGLVAVRRADQGSGADFYVAQANASSDDLEGWVRLEVSGVDRGNAASVGRRLRAKLAQLEASKRDERGIAAVVGFRTRLIRIAWLELP